MPKKLQDRLKYDRRKEGKKYASRDLRDRYSEEQKLYLINRRSYLRHRFEEGNYLIETDEGQPLALEVFLDAIEGRRKLWSVLKEKNTAQMKAFDPFNTNWNAIRGIFIHKEAALSLMQEMNGSAENPNYIT